MPMDRKKFHAKLIDECKKKNEDLQSRNLAGQNYLETLVKSISGIIALQIEHEKQSINIIQEIKKEIEELATQRTV